ncbi:MAG: sugar transferase [Lysobacterales bacterium]
MTRQANALLVILVSFLLAYWLRFGYASLPEPYLVALLTTLLLASIVLPATGAFRQEFEWEVMRKLRRLIAGWAVVVLALISIAAMLKVSDSYSRIWFGLWVLVTSAGLLVVQLISHAEALRERRQDQQSRRVVLVGSGEAAARVEQRLRRDPATRMNLEACFGVAWSATPVQPLESLAEFIREHKIQEVWIATPWEDKFMLDAALGELRESVVDVNVVPDFHQYRLLNQGISEWGGLPVISLAGTPLSGAEKRLKSVFDWLSALVLSVLLAPVFVAIAMLIKFGSPGPVLFRQQRHGVGGDPIDIYKFRSMTVHAEVAGQVTQATPDDARITAVGRFLRATSLDELPQLCNVLLGDMSLVGPRPPLPREVERDKEHHRQRLSVLPGITGMWQVNGRSTITNFEDVVRLDLAYIENWSLWLDFKLLLKTIPAVFKTRGAF